MRSRPSATGRRSRLFASVLSTAAAAAATAAALRWHAHLRAELRTDAAICELWAADQAEGYGRRADTRAAAAAAAGIRGASGQRLFAATGGQSLEVMKSCVDSPIGFFLFSFAVSVTAAAERLSPATGSACSSPASPQLSGGLRSAARQRTTQAAIAPAAATAAGGGGGVR